MCSDRIMWPPGSKIRYRSVFSRNRLDSGRTSPAILISKLFVELILGVSRQRVMFTRYRVDSGSIHSLFVQIPGCVLPLSNLSFSRFLMCSPAIESIAGLHIKNRPHSLQSFADFCQICLADFKGWLHHKVHIYLENHSVCPLVRIGIPHPLFCKQFDGVGSPNSDDWRKGLALCLLCGLSKIHENIHIKKGMKIGLDY